MYIVVPTVDQFSKTETLSSSKFDGIKHHLSGQDQRLHPNPPWFSFFFFCSSATIAPFTSLLRINTVLNVTTAPY